MKAARTCLLLICLGSIGAALQDPSVEVTGRVKDSQKAPLDRALVIILPSSSPYKWNLDSEVRLTTDKNGEIALRLKPGFYDIFVSRAGFTPRAFKFEVLASKKSNFNLSLKMDPQENFPD
jgi:hypothetical protein